MTVIEKFDAYLKEQFLKEPVSIERGKERESLLCIKQPTAVSSGIEMRSPCGRHKRLIPFRAP